MKILVSILVVFFTQVSVAKEFDEVFSIFLHTKCDGDYQLTSVVVTNNTPYDLTINTQGVLSNKQLHPSIFSVFDHEKFVQQQHGLKNVGIAIQKPKYTEDDDIKFERVRFKAFEKKVYYYENVMRHFAFDVSRLYFLSIAGTVLDLTFDAGGQESTVLPNASHIFPTSCFK
jgi:hypothetical protein